MNQHLLHYQTYILRFWQEQDEEQEGRSWRFTLLDPAQDHRYGFSSLEDLMAFLNSRLNEE